MLERLKRGHVLRTDPGDVAHAGKRPRALEDFLHVHFTIHAEDGAQFKLADRVGIRLGRLKRLGRWILGSGSKRRRCLNGGSFGGRSKCRWSGLRERLRRFREWLRRGGRRSFLPVPKSRDRRLRRWRRPALRVGRDGKWRGSGLLRSHRKWRSRDWRGSRRSLERCWGIRLGGSLEAEALRRFRDLERRIGLPSLGQFHRTGRIPKTAESLSLVHDRERRFLTGDRRERTCRSRCRWLGNHRERRILTGRGLIRKTFEDSSGRAHFEFGWELKCKSGGSARHRRVKKLNHCGMSSFTAKSRNFIRFPPAGA